MGTFLMKTAVVHELEQCPSREFSTDSACAFSNKMIFRRRISDGNRSRLSRLEGAYMARIGLSLLELATTAVFEKATGVTSGILRP